MRFLCVSGIFSNKDVCEKCGKRLSKKFFTVNSNRKICFYCQNKENELKKIRKSDENFQYIRQNCRELFVTHSETYVCQTSVWFDRSKGKPCLVQNEAFGPRDSLLYWSYLHIEFNELIDLARKVSEEVYEKYKNMNENNWKEYISFK